MSLISSLIDIFLHLDQHLNEWAALLGPWLYVVLFVIVFCETGLVVTPFLPGDSLLFAVGALASIEGSVISLPLVALLLLIAAIVGDATNYYIGYRVGPRVFAKEGSRLLNKGHLLRAQRFYERHGGKTIILARFIPIIRTFAPFVAGIGQMRYGRFAAFNVVGALCWVLSFLIAGYAFGGAEVVKRNFHFVVVAIVLISVIPAVIEFFKARAELRAEAQGASEQKRVG
jgi:membrane-associated protein